MKKKSNWKDFLSVLKSNNITKLFHFTDRDNLESIISNGGLYSWADCEHKGIDIPKPGGSINISRSLDSRDGLQDYVRLSFVKNHPMMFVAMNEGRISNPVILEIDIETALWENTLYADMNTTKSGAHVGGTLNDLNAIKFNIFDNSYFDLDDDEKTYYKAEILVKNHIPLSAITNIGNFGYTIPSLGMKMQTRLPYTAQITRNTPTAFIFMIDQSVSMKKTTQLHGDIMPMYEAVAKIVNHQLNELVLRCIKGSETRDYYDIAVIGYGEDAYSGWKGELEGRDFVKPSELKEHPYSKTTIKKETRTRNGVRIVEVEEIQWIEANATKSWTRVHHAFDKAKELIDNWMKEHHDKDCYPPTIINITDGEFNGASKEYVLQQANELKSMFTNDGNVILFNIHISADESTSVTCPSSKSEVSSSTLATTLYELSSLLPERYSERIAELRGDDLTSDRYTAMSINADMSTLIQLMDIGTPTNISQNQ